MSKKQKFINPWAWLSAAPKALSLHSWTGQRERAPERKSTKFRPAHPAGWHRDVSPIALSSHRAGREREAQRSGENPSSSLPYAAHHNYCGNHGKQHLKASGILPAVVVSFSQDKNTLLNSLKCFFKAQSLHADESKLLPPAYPSLPVWAMACFLLFGSILSPALTT